MKEKSGINNAFGDKGEQIAYNYLQKNGYTILEKNWRDKHREVDIIALKDNVLIIIEVKTRSSEYFERPQDAVNIKKQKLLIMAANSYVEINDFKGEVQFDIISIILQKNTKKLEHIQDAFYPIL